MMTLEQALRRTAALTLGLLATAGTAAAQGEPAPSTSPPPEPAPAPMTGDVDVDVDVDTPPAPSADVDVQPAPMSQPTYTAPVYTAEPDDIDMGAESTLERYGIAIAAGGGVDGFTNDTLRDATDPGGNWNVRLSVGTRSPIAFEGSYIGSAQSIEALGLDNDAILVGNGLQGNVRVNLLDANIQPFAFAGAAWRHYELTNSDFNTSDVQESDDVLEIPVGAGLAWKYEGLVLDARGEFRYADQEDLMPSLTAVTTEDRAEMHRWGVNANIGYAF